MSEANLLLREDGYPHLKDWLSSKTLDTGRNKPRGALEALRRENEQLHQRIAELENESRTKHEWGMTMLGAKLDLEKQIADMKGSAA